MKVLLIQPPMIIYPGDIPSVVPPLGLAYMAAVLEREGVKTKIIDAVADGWRHSRLFEDKPSHYGLGWTEIESIIQKESPDIAAISCLFSSQAKNAHKVAEIIRRVDKDIVTIMGGAHPSALPELVLADPNVDVVVIGEGEATVLELTKKLESKNVQLNEIEGIAYRDKTNRVRINPYRPLISNLDELPFPARHLLPMEEYFSAPAWHCRVVKHRRFTSMITSRGCPGKCTFCSIRTVWGRIWRSRSPESVVDEIEFLVEKYRIKEIHFEDDSITLNPKRMEKICNEIITRRLDIYWTTPNGVKITTLDKSLLRVMRKSGCYRLHFGIEHGDSEFRDKIIKKPISIEHARKIIKWAEEIGIWTDGFFIIGLPGETEETVSSTIEFAKELDLSTANFFVASPYPGTELYKTSLEHGYIPQDMDWTDMRTSNPVLNTETFNSERLQAWQQKAYREFLLYRLRKEINPLKMLKRIKNIKDFDDLKFLLEIVKNAL
ncbi:Ribosomal protein S12 methylthiotransferase RimO [Candidatus Methanoperedenaceae archaeon GB50]|nr:Ribosomal protein S12 methylthiotransferase RimO [Candidatus Methanoperedenaceae archaeon GB37]CAD7773438.1 Ribosomal protein S12 methylthiotransferase RimO [Candidatus Methanoperedenaceae archaeon GB50]